VVPLVFKTSLGIVRFPEGSTPSLLRQEIFEALWHQRTGTADFFEMTVEGFENLGIVVDGTTPISETLALAKEAEVLGFHSFWLSEGYHSRSAVVRATAIAISTNDGIHRCCGKRTCVQRRSLTLRTMSRGSAWRKRFRNSAIRWCAK
jgi:hypothetical protein